MREFDGYNDNKTNNDDVQIMDFNEIGDMDSMSKNMENINEGQETGSSDYSVHSSSDFVLKSEQEANGAETVYGGVSLNKSDGETADGSQNNISDTGREADVDYSIAAGQFEVVGKTNAYNTVGINYRSGSGNGGFGIHNRNNMYGQNNNAYNNQSATGFNNASQGQYFNADSVGNGNADAYENQYNQYNNMQDNFKPAEKKKMSGGAKRVIAVVLIVCVCALAGFGGGALAVTTLGGSAADGTRNIKIDSNVDSLDAASAIAEKVMPSVVGISTVSQVTTQTMFGLQQGMAQGVGTGIIVSEDGYILTNAHVVDGASSSITVDLYDGKEYDGTVLWSDSAIDLAIVKIDANGLTAAEMGDSDDVKIGDYAVAIGNPLGLNFERSTTQGIISGLDRTITTTDGNSTSNMEGLIQTDASINSGNSGGPLINSKGQVIGINTAKASSAEGLGFAIPINTALPVIDELKENGTYEKSYMGIVGRNLDAAMQIYQIDANTDEGVFVEQIYTNSPAVKAGLQEGDIITAVDGDEVSTMKSLQAKLFKYRPGDTITLTIERNKAEHKVELTLAASSESGVNVKPSTNSNENSTNPYSNQNPYGGIFGN